MKNIIKIVCLSFIALTALNSCEEDPIVFDNENGQTALSFARTSFNLSVPEEDTQLQIPVNVTTVSSQERTFDVVVDDATNPSEFGVGNVVIPAGSYNGTLTVDFDFSEIDGDDGDTKNITLSLVAPNDGATFNNTATVTYFREIVCNDPVLTVNTDRFAEETGFIVRNSDGEVVFEIPTGSFPRGVATYTIALPTLEDGEYSITITDSYEDGQVDGSGTNGSFSLDCSIINLASGGGAFGASQTINFRIN